MANLSEQAQRAQKAAETIAAQLGGTGRIRAMVGGKCMSGVMPDGRPYLSVRHMRGEKRINATRVVLDPTDTYTVEFIAVTGTKCETVGAVNDVYAEDLRGLFTQWTGLALSLGRA